MAEQFAFVLTDLRGCGDGSEPEGEQPQQVPGGGPWPRRPGAAPHNGGPRDLARVHAACGDYRTEVTAGNQILAAGDSRKVQPPL